MECRHVRSRFSGLVDGVSPPPERSMLEKHLAECAGCAAELAALRQFLRVCDKALACPGRPYSFAALKARMKLVEPLEELAVFIPQLRVRGTIPRYAVTALMLMLVVGSQYTLRGTRQVYSAMRSPFSERSLQVNAAAEDVLPGDAQFAALREDMARTQRPLL